MAFIFIDNGEGAEKAVNCSDISAIEIDSDGFDKKEIREFYELLKKEVSQSNA